MEIPTISNPFQVSPPPPTRPRRIRTQPQQSFLVSTAAAAADSATSISHLRQLHTHLIKFGVRDISVPLLSKLLSFSLSSATSSSIHYAISVFNAAAAPPTSLCTRLLRETSRSAEPDAAFIVYAGMREKGVSLERFSFPPLLKAAARVCNQPAALGVSRELHGFAAKLGFDSDPFIQTGIIRAYSAVGLVDDARRMFDYMTYRDLVAWGVMLSGYNEAGRHDDVLNLFDQMRASSSPYPDEPILSTVLSACARLDNLPAGAAVHAHISAANIPLDHRLRAALVAMYAACNSLPLARSLLDASPTPNPAAATSLISAYARTGNPAAARAMFDELPEPDLVAWTAMIHGYVDCGCPQEALSLFDQMIASRVNPDAIAMLGAISAAADLGSATAARRIHSLAASSGFLGTTPVVNALVAMHAKCGSLEDARQVFDKIPPSVRTVISWTAMIHGYAMHGAGTAALQLYDQMKAEKMQPNEVTFLGLLYACAHAGLVDEGQRVFATMAAEHGIQPAVEHYGCMVDLLGRARLLQEALELIQEMPFEPNVVIWGALLGACKVHGDVDLGKMAAQRIFDVDPDHDGAHILLANLYARAGMWEEVATVRSKMKSKGLVKERGCSWAEVNGKVHEFAAGDEVNNEIRSKLDEIVRRLEAEGYVADSSGVLVELEGEEDRRGSVLMHSEKLALAFSLIGGAAKEGEVRIVKNLRVCEDCHAFMAAFSRVFKTEVVLRDRTRFHHFREGSCSCNGFW